MAKSLKKTKQTPEERMAELAKLTGSVAAISHVGPTEAFALPAPPNVAAPAPAPVVEQLTPAVVAQEAPTAAPIAILPNSAISEAESSAHEAFVDDQPQAAALSTSEEQEGKTAPATEDEPELEELVEVLPPTAGKKSGQSAAQTSGGGDVDFARYFAPSSEKKTIMVRITPDNQQFFQEMGLLLGAGASVPEIVHNILSEWREAHEQQVHKALQKQLRQRLSRRN